MSAWVQISEYHRVWYSLDSCSEIINVHASWILLWEDASKIGKITGFKVIAIGLTMSTNGPATLSHVDLAFMILVAVNSISTTHALMTSALTRNFVPGLPFLHVFFFHIVSYCFCRWIWFTKLCKPRVTLHDKRNSWFASFGKRWFQYHRHLFEWSVTKISVSTSYEATLQDFG